MLKEGKGYEGDVQVPLSPTLVSLVSSCRDWYGDNSEAILLNTAELPTGRLKSLKKTLYKTVTTA
jgi:hypothetical protein